MLEIFGTIFIIAAGCVGHFVYDWCRHSRNAALFFAVNESTWEHMKLTIYPSVIWMIPEVIAYGDNSALLPAHLAAMLTMLLLIPLLFYGYTVFTHKSFLIVDISCFCISVCAGMYVFHVIINSGWVASAVVAALSLLVILAIIAHYFIFSFNPPVNFLFRDPITHRYGLSGHPCMHNHKHQNHTGDRHSVLDSRRAEPAAQKEQLDANLEFLRKAHKVYIVAMESELDADSTTSEVIYAGVGKARVSKALLTYLKENRELIENGKAPLFVSLGTAGSGKHSRGEILICQKFANNGDSFIRDEIDFDVLPEPTPYICASSDFFVSEKNFAPGDISTMRESYDCLEMEAYALANICKTYGLEFCAVKCVSDGADDTVANFDLELPKFRAKLNEFVKKID